MRMWIMKQIVFLLVLYLEHEVYWSPLIICVEQVGFTKSCVFGFSVGTESLDKENLKLLLENSY